MRAERGLSGVKRPLHHIGPHCTLKHTVGSMSYGLQQAFLTCKWPLAGFTHCASNPDTGTRPRILSSCTSMHFFLQISKQTSSTFSIESSQTAIIGTVSNLASGCEDVQLGPKGLRKPERVQGFKLQEVHICIGI